MQSKSQTILRRWEQGRAYLSIRMHIATRVYANRVPMDIISTRAFRSNSIAMKAGRKTKATQVLTTEEPDTQLWATIFQGTDGGTCHDSRRQCSHNGTPPAADLAQGFEEQAISGHCEEHPGHWKHGSQQTGERDTQNLVNTNTILPNRGDGHRNYV